MAYPEVVHRLPMGSPSSLGHHWTPMGYTYMCGPWATYRQPIGFPWTIPMGYFRVNSWVIAEPSLETHGLHLGINDLPVGDEWGTDGLPMGHRWAITGNPRATKG